MLSKLLGRTITYSELSFDENKDAMIRAGIGSVLLPDLGTAGSADASQAPALC